MKYIDAERLKAEIERLEAGCSFREAGAYKRMYRVIDSLQQEQSDTDNLCSELADFLIRNDIQEEKAKFLANRISDEYGSKKYLEGLCDGIKQEQPEVDLDEEIYFWLEGGGLIYPMSNKEKK